MGLRRRTSRRYNPRGTWASILTRFSTGSTCSSSGQSAKAGRYILFSVHWTAPQ